MKFVNKEYILNYFRNKRVALFGSGPSCLENNGNEIDGYDLINIYCISPGPEVGEILEAVREAQASGEVATREDGLSLIEGLLPEKRQKK